MQGLKLTIYFTTCAISGTWLYWTVPGAHTTGMSIALGACYGLAGYCASRKD